ncbi:MAG: hypothetical protein JSR39_02590 [Verrucomicrobia bacterium]|nr:hypothetical protein [Verrucomicrobiota bacterium]
MASTSPIGRNSRELNFEQLVEMFENLSAAESKTTETLDSEREISTPIKHGAEEDRLDNGASASLLPYPPMEEHRSAQSSPLLSRSIPPPSATGKEVHPSPSLSRRPIPPSFSGQTVLQPPPLPKRRTLLSIPSDEVGQSSKEKSVDAECARLYQLNTSPSSSDQGSSSSSQLSLRLNLQLLPKDNQLDQESGKQGTWKPLKISPGDISSRFRSPSSPEKCLQIKKSVSIRSLSKEEADVSASTSRHSKKFSARRIALTPREKSRDHTMHHQVAFTSSSSSNDAPLTARGFEEGATELLAMPQRKHKFSSEKAALEIVSCLKRPGGMELVLDLFSQYHHLVKDKRISQRWNHLLTTTLLYPQSLPLILSFIKKESIPPDAFAQIIISGFHHKKTPSVEATYILSLYTLEDLKGQDPKTLFRDVHLSSSLHKEYGTALLDNYLKRMRKEVAGYWRRGASPADLCLNDKRIHQTLLQTHRGYDQLDPEKQLEIRGAIILQNIEACTHFFRFFLETLYAEPIPPACQDLLSMRRSQIFTKLRETLPPEEAFIQSEVLVGEIFFLRILNPFLLYLGKLPVEVDSLINLTKMTQAMSNQVKFGTEKHDEVFESFNEIYDQFLGVHHEFINKNFPLRSS